MKIACISAIPPNINNKGGPTSLLYNLIKYAPLDHTIDVYYYNFLISAEHDSINSLNKKTKTTELFKSEQRTIKKYLSSFFLRRFYSYYPEIVHQFPVDKDNYREIISGSYDLYWIYPYWLINWANSLKEKPIIVTGMDSASLLYERQINFGEHKSNKKLKEWVKLKKQNFNLENFWSNRKIPVHFVGVNDMSNYLKITNSKGLCFYSPLPISCFKAKRMISRKKLNEKIVNVLIDTSGSDFYLREYLDHLIETLSQHNGKLSEDFIFYIKEDSTKKYSELLKNNNLSIKSLQWVDDYLDLLSEIDIQIFPISVGTGTKTKVLDAASNGVLCVGSTIAFENIHWDVQNDAILIEDFEKITDILLDIKMNREYYINMSMRGAQKVYDEHNPDKCAIKFWDQVLSAYNDRT